MNDSDCVRLVGQLYQLIDGEIGEEQVEFLQAHLEECGDCLMRLGVEAHFTHMVREKCAHGDCPDEVILSIKQALAAEVVVHG
ncbi:MAG: zf-HC2 domain-containing protein [Actinomycetota bacterium]